MIYDKQEIIKNNMELDILYYHNADNPVKDKNNLSTLVCFNKKHKLGNVYIEKPVNMGKEEIEKVIQKKYGKMVYLTSLYFSDVWKRKISSEWFDINSYWTGFGFVTEKKACEKFGVKKITREIAKECEKIFHKELYKYSSYLQHQVFEYRICELEDCPECRVKHKKIVDTGKRFFGNNVRKNGMLEHINPKYKFLLEDFIFYEYGEQVEDLMCPICKNKKIIMHTPTSFHDKWRVRCENHIWNCHFKTWYYKEQFSAIKEIKKMIVELKKDMEK